MARVAFCGLGAMGTPMALRLVQAGHEVRVWNRTAERAEPLVRAGARAAATPAAAAAGAEAAITMLATPEALAQVVGGPEGLAAGLADGATLVEMSTVGPDAVRAMAALLPEGTGAIDAPVLGSVPQATAGTLKIFVGGDRERYARLEGLLSAMGSPRHLGPLGAGAAMKLVVNSTLGPLMTTVAEAMALGDALGLDQTAMLDVLADSAIGVTVRGKRDRIESGAYPPNFKLALARKDAALVAAAGGAAGMPLRIGEAALAWLAEADDAGLGAMDYSAVIAHVRHLPARAGDGGAA